MKTTEVFVAGGMPSVTYNPRTELGLEDSLRDFLQTRHKLISITGPTKSGKTVLCRRNVNEGTQVLISGGEVSNENDFWTLILDQLNISYQDSSSITTLTEENRNNCLSSEVSLLGTLKVKGERSSGQKIILHTLTQHAIRIIRKEMLSII